MLRHVCLDQFNPMTESHTQPGTGQVNSSSSSMLDACLGIQPRSLEQRFWSRRCNSRLKSLDALYELCTTLIWLSILPMLEGSDRGFAKASLMLAVAQLVVIHLTPQVWLRCRSVFLSTALLVRCALLLIQHSPLEDSMSTGKGAAESTLLHQQPAITSAESDLTFSITMAAGLWGNLLFVLFHQQPVRWQVPLLAISSCLQALGMSNAWSSSSAGSLAWLTGSSNSTSIPHAISTGSAGMGGCGASPGLAPAHSSGPISELWGVGQALNWGFGLLAAGGINTDASCLLHMVVPEQEAAVLATKLFMHGFGGFLLPAFIAYVIEWRYKVMFLLNACNLPQQQRLQVLTPAAAVVRASVLLSMLLYSGWLLMLATTAWVLCCAVASLLSVC